MSNHSCFVTGPTALASTNRVLPQRGLNFVCGQRSTVTAASPKRRARISMGLFGLGVPELAVIAVVGIFVFGPGKIAEMGKDLGGIAGGVKKATSEFKDAMEESLEDADREIERKQLEKEAASSKTVDATAKPVDESVESTNT